METSFVRRLFSVAAILLVFNLSYPAPQPSSKKREAEQESNFDRVLRTDTGFEIKLPKPEFGQTEIKARSSRVEENGRMEFTGNVHITITVDGSDVVEISCEKAIITRLEDDE